MKVVGFRQIESLFKGTGGVRGMMLYDSKCNMCLFCKRFVDYWDTKRWILWVGLEDAEFEASFQAKQGLV
jgi:predicted DCC family thiol-disulfide oxidoreductase YuxK